MRRIRFLRCFLCAYTLRALRCRSTNNQEHEYHNGRAAGPLFSHLFSFKCGDIGVPSVGHVSADRREFRGRYYPNELILTERSGRSLDTVAVPEVAQNMLLPVSGKTCRLNRSMQHHRICFHFSFWDVGILNLVRNVSFTSLSDAFSWIVHFRGANVAEPCAAQYRKYYDCVSVAIEPVAQWRHSRTP